jgi:hypothetical protein
MAEAIELAAGRAYRARLAGSKRVDPIVVDKVEGGQVSYRITWMSKGARVFGKPYTKPLAAVEIIATLDLTPKTPKPKAEEPTEAKAEAPKVEEAKRPRPRRQKATATV